ncbi:hypothetical protein MNEG_14477 [Monoraphidium neglectum]|uniref:Uncharacterized protein n=1 Tax=Monoraphidium neglectum TaxID=145388 RepID=A0A0D2ME81_9CHLO|nr:hypothetical protein MNEG_14477 [Monoraphidium neglectum]KIY93485.1 hypothetical protein MNEG_14477 [Monoraphidium neglectum]|eukprot:XP_013892505.1 hypothetical protein MNEG_14477 [Monoraphidium neglectum]
MLVETCLSPATLLPAVSCRKQLLLVLASGLMVARALLVAELMWFTGTCSGAVLAVGQLLVVAAHVLGRGRQPPGEAAAAAAGGLAAALGLAPSALRAGRGSILARRPCTEQHAQGQYGDMVYAAQH